MKKVLPKILFYYSALVAVLITLSSGSFVFFFLPILTYFLMEASHQIFFSKSEVLSGKMERLLVYYSFILSALMVVTGLVSARSPMELISASLFSPILLYFIIQILPKRNKAINLPAAKAIVIEKEEPKEVTKLKKEGVDIDRRAFLKLIGTAGLSLFLFSMFTKRAEAAFFGSVPGPGTVSIKDSSGVKIDPSEKHPTDGYRLTELDDGASFTYAGYLNKTSAWFIMRDDGVSYRYTKGSSNFSTNWTDRASLTYDYYDSIF